MKALCLACFFFSAVVASAQNSSSFPQSFIGHWQGTLLWYGAGMKEPQKVKMQLIIRPADSANAYSWQIIYGDKGDDNRPYILRPVDTAKGHWQIDERNGIVLDQYFVGNRLTSVFTVQASTIVASYWREGKNLTVEFYSYSARPLSTSGNGTDESPKVDSYAMKGFQRAVLNPLSP